MLMRSEWKLPPHFGRAAGTLGGLVWSGTTSNAIMSWFETRWPKPHEINIGFWAGGILFGHERDISFGHQKNERGHAICLYVLLGVPRTTDEGIIWTHLAINPDPEEGTVWTRLAINPGPDNGTLLTSLTIHLNAHTYQNHDMSYFSKWNCNDVVLKARWCYQSVACVLVSFDLPFPLESHHGGRGFEPELSFWSMKK